MLHILSLFGRSPFAPLQRHMEKVADCVYELKALFASLAAKDFTTVDQISEKISELEHAADHTKNDIRNHLPTSIFLSIDRNNFLEILLLQDSIADKAEDIAVLLTLRKLEIPELFHKTLFTFLEKNIECFQVARKIIQELHDLLESSFGGIEAEKVKGMCDDVAFKEHEADVIQRDLLKGLFACEDKMSYGAYIHWQKIFEEVGAISDVSEKLANCVRMTLELK